jgi:hypothetical protein
MKLYVVNNNKREYLNLVANTRQELADIIGSPWFIFNNKQYHVHQVVATSETNNTAAGAVIGGIIGLLGGPFGVLVGGTLGGALGNSGDTNEAAKVNRFNQSTVSR